MTFCSEYSRLSGEQLFGTAKPVELWLLIEHRGRWQKEAAESLPAEARDAVERLRIQYPGLKLALIRQHGRTSPALSGFLAVRRDAASRIFSFTIDKHEDLAALDFARILSGQSGNRELFLVCTHGLHDRCCAKFGISLFKEIQRAAGNDAWQVSHVGGCRFAPNVVCLPQGVVYGRVLESDCALLVEAARANRVIPRLLRGRSYYGKPAQAAEYFLSTELGETRELNLEAVDEYDDGWTVTFGGADRLISLRLIREETGISTFKSCSTSDPSPRPGLRLMESHA